MPIKIREPQQLRSMEKKQRILDAGLKCFSTLGYFSTTTVDIAKEAGVSTGLIYGYFKDKEDVLMHVLEMFATRFLTPMRNLTPNLTPDMPLSDRLNEIYETMCGVLQENRIAYREMKIASLSHKKVNIYFASVKRQLMDMMEEALRPATPPTVRYHETVVAAYWLLESLCVSEVYNNVGVKQIRVVLDTIVKMLEPAALS